MATNTIRIDKTGKRFKRMLIIGIVELLAGIALCTLGGMYVLLGVIVILIGAGTIAWSRVAAWYNKR
jgi:hypothetical protein